jgi:inosose dehydratase
MMNIKIGSAPDNWGVWFPDDEKQMPWHRFMDEIAEAGYGWTELGPYGYLPTDINQLKQELADRGLRVSGTFIMGDLAAPTAWGEIERQLLGAGKILQALGAKFLVLIDDTYSDLSTGEQLGPAKLDEQGWKRLVDTTHKVAGIAKDKFGLTTVFHPHAETHVQYEDQIERLLEDTDPMLIRICFDTGHHEYCGGNAVAFMRKHHERIDYLHLKNVDRQVRQRVMNEKIPFAQAVAMDMFCELANGTVDFNALGQLLDEIDFVGDAIVEQDMYPAPFDKPLPIAKRNRQYLKDIGLG